MKRTKLRGAGLIIGEITSSGQDLRTWIKPYLMAVSTVNVLLLFNVS